MSTCRVATLVVVPAVGIVGVEWARLSAQSVAAAVILLHRHRAQKGAES